jgi:hypothetical protein
VIVAAEVGRYAPIPAKVRVEIAVRKVPSGGEVPVVTAPSRALAGNDDPPIRLHRDILAGRPEPKSVVTRPSPPKEGSRSPGAAKAGGADGTSNQELAASTTGTNRAILRIPSTPGMLCPPIVSVTLARLKV